MSMQIGLVTSPVHFCLQEDRGPRTSCEVREKGVLLQLARQSKARDCYYVSFTYHLQASRPIEHFQ